MQAHLTQTGQFATANASRYLQQLCKHFGHKTYVRFDAHSGEVTLHPGVTTLTATDDTLVVAVSADSVEGLAQSRRIIDKHLERFAFREGFTTMDWAAPPS